MMSLALASALVTVHKCLAPIREGLVLTFWGEVSRCRHQPTCSEFLLTQVKCHGWRGFWVGIKRLLTCC